ncbi:hypothetical protein HHI36_019129 [Cryptolaemus montrouzieri]|uniref:Uncharacterized protein n=1 Tax=Cryptolaemus montrouzieri TaxID=559131 RepID=A0ABD2P2J3_9CUCU
MLGMIRTAFLQYFFISFVYCLSDHPILIVVSYDAFRYNFFDTHHLPLTEQLRKHGTYADYLINVFPTKTFPNHHSIATGLYPEKHGVVGNSFWDQKQNKLINVSYELYHYNEEIVPIWRYNEDMGRGRYSASMMWPGAIYSYQNKNITYAQHFNMSMDWYERIDKVISWIKNPDKPANLIMVYFEEPDTHGHAFGPNSDVVENLLVKLDKITQYLEDQLQIHSLKSKVNVVHLSDHGLVPVLASNILNITQYLEPGTYERAGTSPLMDIIPKDGYEGQIYKNLKAAAEENENFDVYKKSEFLDRWHYKNNPRSPPILVMAKVGFALEDITENIPFYTSTYNISVTDNWEFGVHGYDYIVSDMNPFFMARGPKIKANHKVPTFHTVDLFNLFCRILELPTVNNDGSLSIIDGILLTEDSSTYTFSSVLLITVGGVLLALILISCAALVTLLMIKRQQNITTTAALNKRFPQTFTHTIEAQHLLDPEEA